MMINVILFVRFLYCCHKMRYKNNPFLAIFLTFAKKKLLLRHFFFILGVNLAISWLS